MEKYNNYWAFERFTYCTPGVSYLTGSVLSVLVIMPQAHSCTHRIRWRSKQPSLHTHHSAEGRASEWSNNRHIMSTHFWVKVNLKSAITDFFFFSAAWTQWREIAKAWLTQPFYIGMHVSKLWPICKSNKHGTTLEWIQGRFYDLLMNPRPKITLLLALFLVSTSAWRSLSVTWCRGSGVHRLEVERSCLLQAKNTTRVERVNSNHKGAIK